jgi:hypothetical protein
MHKRIKAQFGDHEMSLRKAKVEAKFSFYA